MPEGPEIRRAADRIARALVGRVIERVQFAFERLVPFRERLEGRTVESVDTRGKALLIRFADESLSIYSHNQLYGRWYVRKRDSLPGTNRQLRLALHTADHSALLYSASEIDVLEPEDVARHPFLRKLGPDVLDPTLRPSRVRRRLEQKRFRKRRLAGLLLDQSFLCGTGNYLRSEILFRAAVDPTLRPCDLDDSSLRELAKAIVDTCRRAYRSGGITTDPDFVREAKAAKIPRSRYRHFVFARSGQPCRACGSKVERCELAGRRLYHCPGCQSPDHDTGREPEVHQRRAGAG